MLFRSVEATIAMHYVFNSPIDKIVFDVSHQCYTHKILTGRRDAFINNQESGYTNPRESEHDFFIMGHTSTGVSLACGLAKGRDLKKEKSNIIAFVGDGALSGGEAYEGLDNVSILGSNMIIVVNDNQWSIAEDHGGLYKNLRQLRESNGECECNFFRALGLDYMYVSEGNDIPTLIKAFESIKDIDHPIVIHIHTLKGKGYEFAIKDEEKFHWTFPFNIETGENLIDYSKIESYNGLTGEYLLKKMKENPELIAITSATPSVISFFAEQRKEAGKQFFDVGIAEEHAVAFASGIAKAGCKSVYPVYETFIQRSFDQLLEDLCLNNNPALLLVFAAGLYGIPDASHLGFFDIPFFCAIPNMVYLAPVCKEEYLAMLEWGIKEISHPVAIRVPANGVFPASFPIDDDYSRLNTFRVTKDGTKIAVIAAGSFYQLGESVINALEDKTGIKATLINPRYLTGVDNVLLDAIKANHQLVITLEDGIIDGGFGERIASFYGDSDMKVLNYGLKKEFIDRYKVADVLKDNRLTDIQIVEDICSILKL